ncbi:hypothetical protein F3Y22_tig00006570pilonHSYRG00208 [Hibiscus syriacus]|uniref:Uncharacterized protein n=1 Tax=Hibiscus syriacus TaxID=106335 RepID=A0A6A3CGL3_HIBSY|nr:hypothetical protein F3Y22_tig00006570pilonHSYRG00208 [Hibiscus syriacus]
MNGAGCAVCFPVVAVARGCSPGWSVRPSCSARFLFSFVFLFLCLPCWKLCSASFLDCDFVLLFFSLLMSVCCLVRCYACFMEKNERTQVPFASESSQTINKLISFSRDIVDRGFPLSAENFELPALKGIGSRERENESQESKGNQKDFVRGLHRAKGISKRSSRSTPTLGKGTKFESAGGDQRFGTLSLRPSMVLGVPRKALGQRSLSWGSELRRVAASWLSSPTFRTRMPIFKAISRPSITTHNLAWKAVQRPKLLLKPATQAPVCSRITPPHVAFIVPLCIAPSVLSLKHPCIAQTFVEWIITITTQIEPLKTTLFRCFKILQIKIPKRCFHLYSMLSNPALLSSWLSDWHNPMADAQGQPGSAGSGGVISRTGGYSADPSRRIFEMDFSGRALGQVDTAGFKNIFPYFKYFQNSI